jgi:hypothetical protein
MKTPSKTKKKIHTKYHHDYDKTFIISSKKNNDGLDFKQLRHLLTHEKHLVETNNPSSRPFLIWFEQLENNKYDPQYANTSCWIKNILNDDKIAISNKYILYENFKKQYPLECNKFMAKSWNFKPYNKFPTSDNNTDIYIVRPSGKGAFSGKDVVIVHDEITFKKAKLITKRYNNVIASTYIKNPMLFENRKFHLRTYFIIARVEGVYKTYFFDFCELFTAAKPYIFADFDNGEIHDTHFKSTPRDIVCPDDLPSEMKHTFNKKIYPDMKTCMLAVSKMFKKHCNTYPESKNAFEIFGCDFMIRENGSPILLEINDHIGFTMHSAIKKAIFSERYFNTIYNFIFTNTIKPLYSSKISIIKQ